MARGDDTEHSCTPIRRGPDFCRLPVDVPRSVKKVHSTLSPGESGAPDVLSTVDMPPSDTVKNSSTLGPMPSSGARTLLDRATPAKK